MLEDHLKLANPCRRLRSGPAGAYIDDFADWLRTRAVSTCAVWRHGRTGSLRARRSHGYIG